MSELSDYIAANKPVWDAKDARIAELTTCLKLVEVDLSSGNMFAKARAALALSRVRAAIASVEGK